MQTYSCPNGCCKIYVNTYNNKNIKFYNRSSRRKAGVFIEDKSHNKVLLIQSNGNMWGPPKGTLKYGETDRICAIREVEEETGLKISTDDFKKALNIQNRAIYFYVEKDICPVEIPTKYIDNDVTGITWINPDCLEKCIINGNIKLSQHCRIVFYRFSNKIFSPTSTFTLVNYKKYRF
jgi:hypothetical protein